MRTGNPYRIPPRRDQCEHCGNICYSPMEAAFCVVYTSSIGERHEHLCAVHAGQVKRNTLNAIRHHQEIPMVTIMKLENSC